METHSIWFHSSSVCFLSILKGSAIIAPNEEEISSNGMREVQWRGIQCDHLGVIYKMKQLSDASATHGSITAHGRHFWFDIRHHKNIQATYRGLIHRGAGMTHFVATQAIQRVWFLQQQNSFCLPSIEKKQSGRSLETLMWFNPLSFL